MTARPRTAASLLPAALLVCLAALASSLPCAAATLTARTATGKTPAVVGYNLGHFMPGSNAADWWRYSGVKAARSSSARPASSRPTTSPGSATA